MKKMLSLLLVFCLILGTIPATMAEENLPEEENVPYLKGAVTEFISPLKKERNCDIFL